MVFCLELVKDLEGLEFDQTDLDQMEMERDLDIAMNLLGLKKINLLRLKKINQLCFMVKQDLDLYMPLLLLYCSLMDSY